MNGLEEDSGLLIERKELELVFTDLEGRQVTSLIVPNTCGSERQGVVSQLSKEDVVKNIWEGDLAIGLEGQATALADLESKMIDTFESPQDV